MEKENGLPTPHQARLEQVKQELSRVETRGASDEQIDTFLARIEDFQAEFQKARAGIQEALHPHIRTNEELERSTAEALASNDRAFDAFAGALQGVVDLLAERAKKRASHFKHE